MVCRWSKNIKRCLHSVICNRTIYSTSVHVCSIFHLSSISWETNLVSIISLSFSFYILTFAWCVQVHRTMFFGGVSHVTRCSSLTVLRIDIHGMKKFFRLTQTWEIRSVSKWNSFICLQMSLTRLVSRFKSIQKTVVIGLKVGL